MKKLIIPIFMLCIGHAGVMRAADTDVSAIANVVYVEPFEVSPGTNELELSIKMKNTADIRGFQFDLVLPEGVTPTEDGGEYVYWLNASRSPKKGGGQLYHSIEVTKQADGSYRFLVGSTQDKTFTGNDGEIAVIQVDIAAGMEVGDYAITLKDIKLTETNIDNYYETASVESTLTISNSPRTILYETSTLAPVAANDVNVRVKRTINAGNWSTICLPFDMTAAQVKSAFGDDVEVADFTSWSFTGTVGNVESITLGFTSVTAIAKNHPYLIKTPAEVAQFTMDAVTIDPAANPVTSVNYEVGSTTYIASMHGGYTAKLTTAKDVFLSDNQFWYSNGSTRIKAFRATFDFGDVVLNSYTAGARITMSFDNEATGIRSIENGQGIIDNEAGAWYTLDGRKLDKKPVVQGLYIKDGKKMVVK